MIQKDYLLRMIEELASVLARLFGLSSENKLAEAIEYLDKTYDSFFHFEGKLLRYTPQENLLSILLELEEMEDEHLEIIAELLRHEAEIWLKMGKKEEAIDVLKKSIHLLQYLEESQSHLYSLERKNKLSQSQGRLDELL